MGEMTNQEDLSALKDVNVETESAHPGPSVQRGRLPSPGHRPSTALGTRRSSSRARAQEEEVKTGSWRTVEQ